MAKHKKTDNKNAAAIQREKRRETREAQRRWYAKNRPSRGVGRPTLVPKEVRADPEWARFYAKVYAQLSRARAKLDSGLQPLGRLRIADAVAPYVKLGHYELPTFMDFQDSGGQLWRFASASCTLRCLTLEVSAVRKVTSKKKAKA